MLAPVLSSTLSSMKDLLSPSASPSRDLKLLNKIEEILSCAGGKSRAYRAGEALHASLSEGKDRG